MVEKNKVTEEDFCKSAGRTQENSLCNLTLIGSSHISVHSVKEITKKIDEINPFIVAVELDKDRYKSLISQEKNKGRKQKISIYSIRQVGISGFLFALIGSWFSKKLGNIVNMTPGSDMLAAVKKAKEKEIHIALIDQHINITLSRFSKALSFKEIMKILADLFRGLINPKKEIKKYGLDSFDLSKVPSDELIEKMIFGLKERYPSIYKVIIEERNIFMAKKLHKMLLSYPDKKIVAVVGAGHKNEILNILKQKLSNRADVVYSSSFTLEK